MNKLSVFLNLNFIQSIHNVCMLVLVRRGRVVWAGQVSGTISVKCLFSVC